jgi:hypothetical protein
MRTAWLLAVFLVAGCGSSSRTLNALCDQCLSDADCGGNPCFQDQSGKRFCGRPCAGGCPTGFSCQTVGGTGGAAQSCFPDSQMCPSSAADAGAPDLGSYVIMPTVTPIVVAGPVGPQGGSVDRLSFGFTGDTRPDKCGDPYPAAVIQSIYTQMKGQGVQFALDQGDHMFSCGTSLATFVDARTQMIKYVAAATLLGKTVFMTMGNHECSEESRALCTLGSTGTNPNYTAFMEAMQSISPKPYYRFDVTTSTGLAVFIVVADDVWDAAEEAWLTQQLSDADVHAKYTFVSKHHPLGSTEWPQFQQIYDLVTAHKYTLFFTGHSHLYRQQSSDPRSLVIGIGGAPLASSYSGQPAPFWGYGTAVQGADDRIYVTVYDQATGSMRDHFDVGPQ